MATESPNGSVALPGPLGFGSLAARPSASGAGQGLESTHMWRERQSTEEEDLVLELVTPWPPVMGSAPSAWKEAELMRVNTGPGKAQSSGVLESS